MSDPGRPAERLSDKDLRSWVSDDREVNTPEYRMARELLAARARLTAVQEVQHVMAGQPEWTVGDNDLGPDWNQGYDDACEHWSGRLAAALSEEGPTTDG